MDTIESQLAAGLRDIVEDEPTSAAPTALLLHRGRQARYRRSATWAGTALATVAVGALVATALVGAPAHRSPGTVVSPRLALAAAVSGSENISYQVKVTVTFDAATEPGLTTTGAFDPATHTGYLDATSMGPIYYERLVDGDRYTGATGAAFTREPGTFDHLDYDKTLGGDLTATADPQQLFRMLTAADATITENGSGGYHFVVPIDHGTEVGDVRLTTDNRVAAIEYQTNQQLDRRGTKIATSTHVTVELSGYGLPVHVDRP